MKSRYVPPSLPHHSMGLFGTAMRRVWARNAKKSRRTPRDERASAGRPQRKTREKQLREPESQKRPPSRLRVYAPRVSHPPSQTGPMYGRHHDCEVGDINKQCGGVLIRTTESNACVLPTTTKTICSDALIFFRDRPKFHPLLQIERGYCSICSAPRKAFLGAGHPLTSS